MMMTLISIGIAFIALAAGMFLLAKTGKEALPIFYKITSWFIIASSLLIMACASLHCLMSFYGKHFRYDMMMMHDKSQKKCNKKHGHNGYHHKMRNKYCNGNRNYYHGNNDCCENADHPRYWKKVFNDSCFRKERRENK